MSEVDVVYVRPGGQGWGPIDELARLCALLLPSARLTTLVDDGDVGPHRKLGRWVPSPRRGDRALLFLAPSPAHLARAARRAHWLPGYAVRAAWVIDSFWTDRIAAFARHGGHFDHIFVTDRDLVDTWERSSGTPVSWLPWGSDTLQIGSVTSSRPTDLLRLGRQPVAWDDDETLRREGARLGLDVEGRPPMAAETRVNQQLVRAALLRSKFVLAFSNLVSPASYTHPTREYLTGRWMDALAAGATVVGAAPGAASYTLWPGATLEVDATDLRGGLELVAEAARRWAATDAAEQHARARAQLDWRWRIADMSRVLGLPTTPDLDAELALLTRTPDGRDDD